MDPFEYFQQLKPQIEKDEAITRNLRIYAFGNTESLPHLGAGTNNTHYRIGRFGELWLATREYQPLYSMCDSRVQRMYAESYIKQLLEKKKEGKKVPIICGGVRIKSKRDEERFMLILEDLTAGNTKPFISRRGISSLVDGVEVYHDFPEELVDAFRYMVDGKMIELVE